VDKVKGATMIFLLIAALLALPAMVDAQTHTFKLNWTLPVVAADGSNAATGIRIERKQGTTGVYAQIAQLGLVNTYSDPVGNPPPGGVVYCYRLRAFNVVGNSAYTTEGCGTTVPVVVPAAPDVPTGFSVSAISQSMIELSWGTVDTAEGYKWERRKGNQPKIIEATGTVLATATNFRNGSLRRGTTYCYDVSAYNLGGISQQTPILCATTRP